MPIHTTTRPTASGRETVGIRNVRAWRNIDPSLEGPEDRTRPLGNAPQPQRGEGGPGPREGKVRRGGGEEGRGGGGVTPPHTQQATVAGTPEESLKLTKAPYWGRHPGP